MISPEPGDSLAAREQRERSVFNDTSGHDQARWLNRLARAAPRSLLVAMAAPVVSGLLLLVQAWLLARTLDMAISQEAGIPQLLPMIVALTVLIGARACIAWAGECAASRGAERIKAGVRQALFATLVHNGPQWTSPRVSGELASALIDHVEALDGFFVRYLPSLLAAAFLPLVFGLILLPVDWVVGLLLLVSAPLIPVFMMLVGWGAEAASRRHQVALTRLSGLFADRLRGAFTLRLFRRTDDEVDTVRQASRDLSHKTMIVLRIAFLSSAVLEFFAALGVAGVAVYIGLGYLGMLGDIQTGMTLQTGLFCLLLAPEVYNPLRQLAASYHDRAAARAAAGQLEGMFGVLPPASMLGAVMATRAAQGAARFAPAGANAGASAPPQVASASGTVQPRPGHHAGIRFVARSAQGNSMGNKPFVLQLHDVTLYPPAGSRPVLDKVSLGLGYGQSAALVGSSGSGKTTLIEAVCGWRDIAYGQISYRGVVRAPGDTLTVDDGVVLISQRPFFAPATIAENLRIIAPDASDDDLWTALRQACADAFVQALPHGLATPLGVGGYGLSGGERHRLALARLFLTDPVLIFLDEPTAHLDGRTRDAVMASLRAFATGRTLVVATHDPAVAAKLGVVWQIHDAGITAL